MGFKPGCFITAAIPLNRIWWHMAQSNLTEQEGLGLRGVELLAAHDEVVGEEAATGRWRVLVSPGSLRSDLLDSTMASAQEVSHLDRLSSLSPHSSDQ